MSTSKIYQGGRNFYLPTRLNFLLWKSFEVENRRIFNALKGYNTQKIKKNIVKPIHSSLRS